MHLRTPAVLATVAALSLGATACGSDESSSSSSAAASTKKAAEPVAQIDSLTGKSTAVTLDAGFVDALTQLKHTASPLSDASTSNTGVARSPITVDNIKY